MSRSTDIASKDCRGRCEGNAVVHSCVAMATVIVALVSAALVIAASGCGAAKAQRAEPSRPLVSFPTQGSLDQILAQPAPTGNTFGAGMDSGRDWALQGPFPAAIGDAPRAAQSDWERALLEATTAADGRSAVTLTETMHCVAREFGRFWLERRARPGQGLRRFILSFCGSTLPRVALLPIDVEVSEGVAEQDVLREWTEGARQSLSPESLGQATPANLARIAGVWFGRDAERVVVVVVMGSPSAEISAQRAMIGEREAVVVEGALSFTAQYLSGYINVGKFGVAECEPDLTVPLPGFRLVCTPDPGDSMTFVQLSAAPPGKVLARSVGQLMIKRSPDIEAVYRYAPYTESGTVATSKTFAPEMVRRLNKIRLEAGMKPLSLSVAQSAVAVEVAPYYFNASDDSDMSDTIALSMLAGRHIKGDIRSGQFVSVAISPSRDVGEWLSESLALPMGRSTLLDPKIQEIAVGPWLSEEPDVLAAVVSGYVFHKLEYHVADMNMLAARIVKARAKLGLPPPKILGPLNATMSEQLGRVNRGEAEPSEALDAVLENAVAEFGRSMKGFRAEAMNLNAVQLPDELIRTPDLIFSLGVTHHKPPGAAWGQLVVLMAYVVME